MNGIYKKKKNKHGNYISIIPSVLMLYSLTKMKLPRGGKFSEKKINEF